jgi:hypothetical protein
MSEKPEMRYGKKGPNHKRRRRVELGTDVTPGNRRTNLQDPQDDPDAGNLKESTRNVHWVATNEELDTVEEPTSSEAEKGATHGAGAGDAEAPVSTTADDERHRN